MSPSGVILFTLSAVAGSILLGNYYTTFKINRTIWVIITSLSIAAFIFVYIKDTFFAGKKSSD